MKNVRKIQSKPKKSYVTKEDIKKIKKMNPFEALLYTAEKIKPALKEIYEDDKSLINKNFTEC